MNRIGTAQQMRDMDRRATEQYAIPGLLLMERAALSVVSAMEQRDLLRGSIVIVCGKGNNGGDGYAVAWELHRRQCQVSLVNLFGCSPQSEDGAIYYQIVQSLGIPFVDISAVSTADVIVDAVFGTGLSREITEDWVERMNQAKGFVVSVDIPSGLQADSPIPFSHTVQADLTVTFAAWKKALVFYPAAWRAGEVVVADIGIPEFETDWEMMSWEGIKSRLPKRCPMGHKGTFGKVLAVAGSVGMTGAAALCANAALRGGCGLVTLATPKSVQPVLAKKLTEVMTLPLKDEGKGCLQPAGIPVLTSALEQADAVLFGCGVGREESVRSVLETVLQAGRPTVLDADGLFALTDIPEGTVLTPHVGELSRLSGVTPQEIEQDRLSFALSFAQQKGVVLVLKGARTVIATPGGRAYVCPWGNDGMATGGTGDVLAGLLVSFLAQGLTAEDAAYCAVGLHARAGDRAAKLYSSRGMLAGDLLEQLWKECLE